MRGDSINMIFTKEGTEESVPSFGFEGSAESLILSLYPLATVQIRRDRDSVAILGIVSSVSVICVLWDREPEVICLAVRDPRTLLSVSSISIEADAINVLDRWREEYSTYHDLC
jgi:hypothetical protein